MSYSKALVCLLLLSVVLSVDESKFKKCHQSGFCARHRSKPMKLTYTVDPSSVNVVDNKLIATLVPSREQTTDLELVATVLPNNVIRIHIVEKTPLNGRERFEATDVLIPEYAKEQTLVLSTKDSDHVVFESLDKAVRCEIRYNPLHFAVYVHGVLKLSINDKNLFYFEVTRTKPVPNIPHSPISSPTPEPAAEPEEAREIVDYTEAGKAIYSDGTVEGEEEEEEDVEVHYEITPDNTAPSSAEQNNEEKEDETGYWEEYFGGKTDSKPYGPQSVGMDMTFYATQALYGLPEHASSSRLQPTVNGVFSDPYRLFNLDVFEFATHKNTALYGSVPWIVGYGEKDCLGVLWLNPSDTFVDIYQPETDKQAVQWMSEAGVMDVFVVSGATLDEVFKNYAKLTSFPSLPPFFSLGYHQSRWNYLDEKDVEGVSNRFEELNFPYDVMWLDLEYTVGKKYFTWDKENFPDPTRMLENLASKGHRMVTIIDPHVKKESGYRISDEMKQRNMFIKNKNGDVYEGWCWPGTSNYPDFTDSTVREWWGDQFLPSNFEASNDHMYLWNDMNEPSVFDGPEVTMPRDCQNLRGQEHREWHNIYGYYYHTACVDGQKRRSPNQRPFVLSRAFFAGSQRNSAIWTGDVFANFEHLANVVPMLLGLSMGGIPFTGADVPGYFKDPSEEAAVRWYQMGAWMPFFRGHAHIDTKRREPWTFSDSTFQLLRNAVIQRYSWLPHIYTTMWQSHANGTPVIRPLVWSYGKEAMARDEDRAFTFGDSVYVAPVVQQGATTVTAYLPKGRWVDVENGAIITGGSEVTFDAPLEKIPVLQQEGSVVARQMRLRRSALMMAKDPFSYYILQNEAGKAEGWVFHDERDGWGFEKGVYALMKVTMDGKVIRSVRTEGSYDAINEVERIVVYTEKAPSHVKVTEGGKTREVEFLFNEKMKTVTIRKPLVKVTGEWTVELN